MNIPKKCPACSAGLTITELSCPDCRAAVKGSFQLSPLAALAAEDEAFLMAFLRAGGRIKAVEKELGISYPTVKARLRELMSKLNVSPTPAAPEGDQEQDKKARQLEILARLKRGEIFTHEAVALLKDLGV